MVGYPLPRLLAIVVDSLFPFPTPSRCCPFFFPVDPCCLTGGVVVLYNAAAPPSLDRACSGFDVVLLCLSPLGNACRARCVLQVCMGTDTMAYAASALSFMLENLGKTVGTALP